MSVAIDLTPVFRFKALGSTALSILASYVELAGSSNPADYQLTNAMSVCSVDIIKLINGSNTVLAPRGAVGCLACPDPINRYSLTLKGAGADTGILMDNIGPFFFMFAAPDPVNTKSIIVDGSASNYTNQAVTADSVTDKITLASHTLITNSIISFGGTLPGGIITGYNYYVVNPTTNDFQISLTKSGSVVDLTSNGASVTIVSGQECRFIWF